MSATVNRRPVRYQIAFSEAGLAAPQIYEPWRILVIGIGHNPRYPDAHPLHEHELINPAIKSFVDELTTGWEGGISLPASAVRYNGGNVFS